MYHMTNHYDKCSGDYILYFCCLFPFATSEIMSKPVLAVSTNNLPCAFYSFCLLRHFYYIYLFIHIIFIIYIYYYFIYYCSRLRNKWEARIWRYKRKSAIIAQQMHQEEHCEWESFSMCFYFLPSYEVFSGGSCRNLKHDLKSCKSLSLIGNDDFLSTK